MADHIEELRKRGMITSLAKVPVSKAAHIEALRGLVSAAVRKVTGCPDLRAGELSLVSEICAAIDDAMLKAREASND